MTRSRIQITRSVERVAGLFCLFQRLRMAWLRRYRYTQWIRRYDTLSEEDRTARLGVAQQFSSKPLISVVMPVYNPNPRWLTAAIESVRNQIYPEWELCIADDCSTDPQVREVLEYFSQKDSRIKVVFREENGHISAASNSALELATGEWIGLLDHDDLLSEEALFWMADAVNKHPAVRMIYSDEDKVTAGGRRQSPYFKPDWNVGLFYSQNMFCHFGVYCADLIRNMGGFRVGFEGAQDYDLALRCVEQVAVEQIVHIPRILYHWRVHSESTAQAGGNKPYAVAAGERALREHFDRMNVEASVESVTQGYRVRYDVPNDLPKVSLVVLTRGSWRSVERCVESVFSKTDYPNIELVIVDSGSDDPEGTDYLERLNVDARVSVIRAEGTHNLSALNNQAARVASGDILCFLSDDVEVSSPEWLAEMVSFALQPDVGVVGARLWRVDGTLQHAGMVLGLGGVAGFAYRGLPNWACGSGNRAVLIQDYSAVSFDCAVVRKTLFEQVGGLNETDLPRVFGAVDFCLRVREAGCRNRWTPYAELLHHESEDSFGKNEYTARETRWMKQQWGDALITDPAYNPNLTLEHEDFSLAWPPRASFYGECV